MAATTTAPTAVAALPPNLSVCLGVSGSVAAVKAPELASALLRAGASVDVVLTEPAHALLQASYRGAQPWAALEALAAEHAPDGARPSRPTLRLWRDRDEWDAYRTVGEDAVLHVELAKRNQLLLIAPLCAHTLASAAMGLCGNLLSSVVRAWYYDLEEEFAAPLAAKYGRYAVNRPLCDPPL